MQFRVSREVLANVRLTVAIPSEERWPSFDGMETPLGSLNKQDGILAFGQFVSIYERRSVELYEHLTKVSGIRGYSDVQILSWFHCVYESSIYTPNEIAPNVLNLGSLKGSSRTFTVPTSPAFQRDNESPPRCLLLRTQRAQRKPCRISAI